MKKLMKIVKWTLLTLVVLLVLAVVFAGPVAKFMFNNAAPAVLGVDARVDHLGVNLFTGDFSLGGLHIGNPEGFKTDALFELESVDVKMSMKSLFTDTIVIPSIHVKGTDITYEQGLTSNNLSALLEKFESEEEEAEAEEEAEEPAKEGKKVVIEDLQIEDSTVHLALTLTQGLAAPIPLPPLHLTGIGAPEEEDEEAGASIGEAITEVLKAVSSSVTGAAGAALGATVDAVKAVGSGAADLGGAAVEGIANAAGAAGDAISDGLGSAGDAISDGLGAAGDAVADGAKALAGLLPFGGGDDDAESGDADAAAEE